MIIKSAEFVKSSSRADQCPPPVLPEYAFIGRSNVGKSSLINMLVGNRKLAKISSTPGKTQLINHFIINNEWYIADLPGYGYARVSRKLRIEFSRLIGRYIETRRNLLCLFLLIDSRHAPMESDISFINHLGENQVPFMLVFTKCDKLSATRLERNLDNYMKHLGETWEQLPGYFCTSILRQSDREQILDFIAGTNASAKFS